MAQLPLLGGAYSARSSIANAQRCVNLYPEQNQADAEFPVTHYQTPGLLPLASGIAATWRGLYFATNGALYGVNGTRVYKYTSDLQLVLLGEIPLRTTPVSMVDNGQYILIVDGSVQGWTIDLGSDAFAELLTPNFTGGDFVKYLDGFFLLNRPGTREFYGSRFMSLTFDALDFAQKIGTPDPIVGLEVMHREVWLIGDRSAEIWALVGTAGFPFKRIDGAFIEHGCAAKYSIARYNLDIFWLSRDNNGQALVLRGSGYQVEVVSNPAIAWQLSQYATISDAQGFVYQQGTHIFYVLNFPTVNKTWCYDLSTKEWHERAFTDLNGNEGRIRANCVAAAYGKTIVGDYQNGKLYEWSLTTYNDAGFPIIRRRGFPYANAKGKVVYHAQFMANIEVGTIEAGKGTPSEPRPDGELTPERTPLVSLRWSDTRGKSWGEPVTASLGATGEYDIWPSWRDLGQARERIYELFWSEDCATALNGAYLDAVALEI